MSVPSHESTWTRGAPHMPASCRLNTWPASRMRIERRCGSRPHSRPACTSMLVAETGGRNCRIRIREGNLLYRGELFAIYVLKGHQRRGVKARHFIS